MRFQGVEITGLEVLCKDLTPEIGLLEGELIKGTNYRGGAFLRGKLLEGRFIIKGDYERRKLLEGGLLCTEKDY